jgi:hypothetical protein
MGTPFISSRSFVGVIFLFIAASSTAAGQERTSSIAEPANGVHPVPREVSPKRNPEDRRIRFSDDEPGIVIVEIDGERLRIDANRKTVELLSGAGGEVVAAPAAGEDAKNRRQANAPQQQEESAYDFDKGEEPYDQRLINLPTPKSVPKGSWNVGFTHRFTQPVHPLSSSARNLLGLDSFGVASFGVTYGITDKLSVSAYRSPLCQRGMCRTIEIGFAYNFLEHDKDSPIALAAYGSVEGNGNFTEEYTYNLQARIGARLGKRVYLFFSPAVHLNANGQGRFDPRPNDYFPPATVAAGFRQPAHGASYGFGTAVLITPNLSALFEFVPRTGFKLGSVTPIRGPGFVITGFRNESEPTIGFGIQRNIGNHAFALTFSNTQTTTTSRYNSSNLFFPPQRLVIGFNLSRRF